jgi:uncharacterized protein (TIGR03089 family)
VTTPSELLARRLSSDGTRPLLTFYDDATGARAELSVATTANWVAKTANYLTDEHGVDPGDLVGIRLPVHWQSAVVALASWAVGAQVSFDESGRVTFTDLAEPPPDDATVVLSLDPMGADFSRLVATQPDSFVAMDPSGDDLVAATPIDLPSNARVLTVLTYEGAAAVGYGLIGPLAVDGSVVLIRHADPSKVADHATTERATHSLGVSIDGLPRLDG